LQPSQARQGEEDSCDSPPIPLSGQEGPERQGQEQALRVRHRKGRPKWNDGQEDGGQRGAPTTKERPTQVVEEHHRDGEGGAGGQGTPAPVAAVVATADRRTPSIRSSDSTLTDWDAVGTTDRPALGPPMRRSEVELIGRAARAGSRG